jgi:hypothetical protein
MRCAKCGMEVVVPARFCGYCGDDLKRQPVAQGGSVRSVVDAPSQAVLQMVVGAEIDRQYPLAGVMYVGRELDNDVQVNDPRISRRHARIRADGTRVTVADLGSTNGTLVNDVPITGEYVLHEGDLVRMGHSEWAFYSAYSSSAPRPAQRRPVEAVGAPAYPPRQPRATRATSQDIVESDELPWSAIAIVVGGLIIGFSICCIAAVFLMSR